MDNFYTGTDLLIDKQTAACGTMWQRRGAPKKHTTVKFKEQGEYKVMSYNHQMIGMRLLDSKHVNLLSIVYGSMSVNTGRKHWQTKQQTFKSEISRVYYKFMSGVDLNDQLLQYSAFSRQSTIVGKGVVLFNEYSYGE